MAYMVTSSSAPPHSCVFSGIHSPEADFENFVLANEYFEFVLSVTIRSNSVMLSVVYEPLVAGATSVLTRTT